MLINRLSTTDADFQTKFSQLLAWEAIADSGVIQTVDKIIEDIRSNGDSSLLEFTNKFDKRDLKSIKEIILSKADLEKAFKAQSNEIQKALVDAADRIKFYHQHQFEKNTSWEIGEDSQKENPLKGQWRLGQRITPLDSVGLYVPGGKAAYPSSVLMNAIPAKVAGVENLVMVVPAPQGNLNLIVLAAAFVAGVDKIFTIGGAQAIAALAYGTETIPKVDKIVGPGNIYVAAAKRAVFGQVGIDMIAGPSEILIVCDGKTPVDWITNDLFSQAEHDEQAQSILISWDENYLNEVEKKIAELLPTNPRKDIIEVSLKNRGALILVENEQEAADIANKIAPEHLELSVENPRDWFDKIKHAGALFLGRNTPEALGDYCAGPNHVLPTSGTARFSSPLGVYNFQKRSSILEFDRQSASLLADTAAILARAEGLEAHARSAEARKL